MTKLRIGTWRRTRGGETGEPFISLLWVAQDHHSLCWVLSPGSGSSALAVESSEVPEQYRVFGEDHFPTLDIAIAARLAIYGSRNGSSEQPTKGEPARIVQTDDQFGSWLGDVLPTAVGSIHHPFSLLGQLVDTAALLIVGNFDPTREPG